MLRLFVFEDVLLGGEKSNLLKLRAKGKKVQIDESMLGGFLF